MPGCCHAILNNVQKPWHTSSVAKWRHKIPIRMQIFHIKKTLIHVLIAPDFAMWFWLDMQWKTKRHKIENMPLQPSSIFFGPWQMCQYACFSSKILCVVNLVENRMRVKSLGIAPGLVNARTPGRADLQVPLGQTRQENARSSAGRGVGCSWN